MGSEGFLRRSFQSIKGNITKKRGEFNVMKCIGGIFIPSRMIALFAFVLLLAYFIQNDSGHTGTHFLRVAFIIAATGVVDFSSTGISCARLFIFHM